jgi:RNA-directed DNA polymerase
MKRVRHRIKALTGREETGMDIRDVIATLSPILRGWGNSFRTGNASDKLVQIDFYVIGPLRGLMIRRHGGRVRPALLSAWTRQRFGAHGVYRLRGIVSYTGAAS